jgi:hypothetical protein
MWQLFDCRAEQLKHTDYCLLAHNAMWSRRWVPKFQKNPLQSSPRYLGTVVATCQTSHSLNILSKCLVLIISELEAIIIHGVYTNLACLQNPVHSIAYHVTVILEINVA